jgi:hypothetical protein
MKLNTKIEHAFDINSDSMDDIEFTFDLPEKTENKRIKIVEIKRQNFKKDVSTRLF